MFYSVWRWTFLHVLFAVVFIICDPYVWMKVLMTISLTDLVMFLDLWRPAIVVLTVVSDIPPTVFFLFVVIPLILISLNGALLSLCHTEVLWLDIFTAFCSEILQNFLYVAKSKEDAGLCYNCLDPQAHFLGSFWVHTHWL